MQEKYISVDGHNIRYLESGSSSKKLVLLHGLGGYAERWRNIIPYLSEKYHVFVPDLIGYGKSDKPSVDYTVELFVRFTFDFINALGLRKTNLMGTSLGGQVAVECAATQ